MAGSSVRRVRVREEFECAARKGRAWTRGVAPFVLIEAPARRSPLRFLLRASGGAEPRLTSGGRAPVRGVRVRGEFECVESSSAWRVRVRGEFECAADSSAESSSVESAGSRVEWRIRGRGNLRGPVPPVLALWALRGAPGAGGVVVRVGCFLRWAQVLGDVAKVYADAGPRR